MCTRFYIDVSNKEMQEILREADRSVLKKRFLVDLAKPIRTSGEVRPTDVAAVIAPDRKGNRAVFPMQWGFLVPGIKGPLVNAKSETAAERPTFRDAFRSRRCVIPASWYFEWEHRVSESGKTVTGDKYAIQPAGSEITWLAGLYRIEDGYPRFVVLTREPSEEIRKIHDRMPLILPEEQISEWIRPDADPGPLLSYALTDLVAEKSVG